MNKPVAAMVGVVAVLAVVFASLLTVLITRDDDQAPLRKEAGSTEPPSADLAPYYDQTLTWTDCGSGEQCSKLHVPVDYEKPDGDAIDLKLKRVQAADQGSRIGSLVVNPGGPGAPGSSMADDADFYFGQPLLDQLDIVAFDPRGTGESDPVDCLSDAEVDDYVAEDPSPDDAAEGRELTAEQDTFFKGCVANSDDLVAHVSTVEAAKDMDVLRAALGESRLSYLGFSYGTKLGATYAQLFPEKVGRMVLDGAIDPALDFRESAIAQAGGFETALRAYVQNCLDGGDCFLGSTMDEALGTITDLLDSIDQGPLPTSSDRELKIGNAFYGVVLPLYSKDNWPYLDQGLQDALSGDGSTLLLLSDTYASRNAGGGYDDNSLEAILAINCLDDPSFIEPGDVPAEYPAFEKSSPTFGKVFAWGLVGCHGLQVEPEFPEPKITATGAAPIVVIGTTRDPATPYKEAVALAGELDSGVLISRDGDGHTGYNKGNGCVDDAVEGYLLDGDVPDHGLRC